MHAVTGQPPCAKLGGLHGARRDLASRGILLQRLQASLHRLIFDICVVALSRTTIVFVDVAIRAFAAIAAKGEAAAGGAGAGVALAGELRLGQRHRRQLGFEQAVALLQSGALALPALTLLDLPVKRRLHLLDLALKLRAKAQPRRALLPLALQLAMEPVRLFPRQLHLAFGPVGRVLEALLQLPVELGADAPQAFREG